MQPVNIPDQLKVLKAFAPQASAAATINGTGIDRMPLNPGGEGYLSCVLKAQTGAATGGPTTQTLDCKLQDSADNSTFADYKPDGVNVAAITQITAVNAEQHLNVDLRNARRYIRAVATVGFTGGASPTLVAAGDIVLCGDVTKPVSSYS